MAVKFHMTKVIEQSIEVTLPNFCPHCGASLFVEGSLIAIEWVMSRAPVVLHEAEGLSPSGERGLLLERPLTTSIECAACEETIASTYEKGPANATA